MARKRPRRFIINDPIFGAEYYVQRGGDVHEALKWFCDKLGHEPMTIDTNPTVQGCFVSCEPNRHGLLWFFEDAKVGIIAHECLHAVTYTMDRVGLKLSEHTDEVFAYTLQWLIEEIVGAGR